MGPLASIYSRGRDATYRTPDFTLQVCGHVGERELLLQKRRAVSSGSARSNNCVLELTEWVSTISVVLNTDVPRPLDRIGLQDRADPKHGGEITHLFERERDYNALASQQV